MSADAIAAWLFRRTTGGVRWGLERTQQMLAGVGDPHRRFAALHIGGTNGKGSVAACCEAVLRGAGHRVGLYTSPHLVSFAERIRIDGHPVDEALLAECVEALRPGIEASGATFFEAATAVAFLCFARAGVELAVVEVGLGGRLDATNVLQPLAAAITTVALDHTEYLGESLEQIAREKAGILKPGVPAVTGVADAGLLEVLRAEAARMGAPLRVLDEVAPVEAVRVGVEGTTFTSRSAAWGEHAVRTPLLGEFQARNAALAAELLALLPEGLRPAWVEVERGLAAVRWPGRMQLERVRGTTWLFDVAHNPAGVQALTAALDALGEALPRPRVLLAGVLADKDWRTMLPPLLARVDAAILTIPPTAPPARRWDPEAAARALEPHAVPVRVIPHFAAALSRATTLAPHGTVLVTGSVHTVGDALAELGLGAG